MKKNQLMKLYDTYLKRNSQEVYVRNIKPLFIESELVESAHLRNNQVLEKERLPKYLKFEQIRELDDRYNNELKWEMLESCVTDDQIKAFEKEYEITIPKKFREYLQGYSFLQGEFYPKCAASEDYCDGAYDKETGEYISFTDEDWEREEDLVGNTQVDFFGLINPNGIQGYKYYIKNIGMIHLGNLDTGDLLLLDCDTGEIQSWDHETAKVNARSKKEFQEVSMLGSFWFRDFDAFLEWLLGKTVYDFDKAEEEAMELHPRQYVPKQYPPDSIIYL